MEMPGAEPRPPERKWSLSRRRRLAGVLLRCSFRRCFLARRRRRRPSPDQTSPSKARLRGEGAASRGRAETGFGRLRGLQKPQRRGPGAASKPGRASPGTAGLLARPAVRAAARAWLGAGNRQGEASPWVSAGPAGGGRLRSVSSITGETEADGGGTFPRSLGESGRAAQGAGLWAVRGRPGQGFCSLLTPPPLCARADPPQLWASGSAWTSWRSLLWAWEGRGPALGVPIWGQSFVNP